MSYTDLMFAERIMDLCVESELRQAETRRFARQALAGRRTAERWYAGALRWLGARMLDWGERLTERSRAVAPGPTPHSASGQAG